MPFSLTTKAASGRSSSRSGAAKSGSSRRARPVAQNAPAIATAEFDRRAEAGKDMSDYIEWTLPMTPAQFRRHLEKQGVQVPEGL